MHKRMNYLIVFLLSIFLVGCTSVEDTTKPDVETGKKEVATVETNENNEAEETAVETTENNETEVTEETETSADNPVEEETPTPAKNELFPEYTLMEVDGRSEEH